MTHYRSPEQTDIARRISSYISKNNADEPLLMEAAAGIGKTRAYLIPACAAAAAGRKIVIALPTWALIQQIIESADLAAARKAHPNVSVSTFIPAREFDTRNEYKAHAEKAREADVMFCTTAAVSIDIMLRGNYCGAINRDIRIFDEADQLPDMAALMKNKSIDAQTIADLKIKPGSITEVIAAIVASEEASRDTKTIAKEIVRAMEQPAWWHATGFNREGDAILFNKLPGRVLKKVANKNGSIFVSATLSVEHATFTAFQKSIGITTPHMLSTSIEPKKHGNLTFYVAKDVKYGDPTHEDLCVHIINQSNVPSLVATPSFALAEKLGARCPQAYVRQRHQKIQDAVKAMSAEGKQTLIATAAWAGLDTPIQWKSIIIPQVPFPQPTEIDGEIVSSYGSAKATAARRLKQVMGRGTRFPDSTCDIYLLDARYRYDGLPVFVPARFREQFAAATILDGEFRVFTRTAA